MKTPKIRARSDQRPLLVVVAKEGRTIDASKMRSYLASRVAHWWLPDDVQCVPALPHTATGKLNKVKLREQFREHRLPTF